MQNYMFGHIHKWRKQNLFLCCSFIKFISSCLVFLYWVFGFWTLPSMLQWSGDLDSQKIVVQTQPTYLRPYLMTSLRVQHLPLAESLEPVVSLLRRLSANGLAVQMQWKALLSQQRRVMNVSTENISNYLLLRLFGTLLLLSRWL